MHRIRRWFILPLTCLIYWGSIFCIPTLAQNHAEPSEKKAIILIADFIDTSDLVKSHTPNLDFLLSQSGTGLMNIRAKNRNYSSSYMTLAAGNRVATINNASLSFNYNETVRYLPGLMSIPSPGQDASALFSVFSNSNAPNNGIVNLFIEPVKQFAVSFNPSYQVGSLGAEARELGLKAAVLGNADTLYDINRNSAILVMDEKGVVPQGNVGRDLLEANPLSPGGLQTNHDQIISNTQKLLKSTDILVIDLGDTTRVETSRANTADHVVAEQRKKAIERNDQLLGRVINSVDMDKTMLLIITPNPNKEMISAGNFGLTPAVMYIPGTGSGLLTSNTTRRPGLINSTDLKTTVFSYLQPNYPAKGISTVKADNSLEKLEQQLNLFIKLRSSRNPLHYTFMSLAVLGIIVGLLAFIAGRKHFSNYVSYIVYCTLTMPLIFLFISFTKYSSLGEVILLSLVLSLAASGLLHFLFRDPFDALLFITLTTALLITLDTFTGSGLMLISPLGSDAIAGGRFYGIGNDYMGVLLACTIIAAILGLDKLKRYSLKPSYLALIGLVPFMIVTAAIGHPNFGANMGGCITAVVSIGFFYILMSERKITLLNILLVFLLAIIAVISVAQLDAAFNSNPSHAGKAINSLNSTYGLSVIFSIIKTKIGILGSTLYNSRWSIVLLLLLSTIVILKHKAPELLRNLAMDNTSTIKAAKLLSLTALVVFIVNDTGIIAATIIILYLLNSLWLAIGRSNHQGRC